MFSFSKVLGFKLKNFSFKKSEKLSDEMEIFISDQYPRLEILVFESKNLIEISFDPFGGMKQGITFEFKVAKNFLKDYNIFSEKDFEFELKKALLESKK